MTWLGWRRAAGELVMWVNCAQGGGEGKGGGGLHAASRTSMGHETASLHYIISLLALFELKLRPHRLQPPAYVAQDLTAWFPVPE